MPIPFHDTESIDELGAAAFMRLERVVGDPDQWFGALFFVNARGEPLEFVCNRLALLPSTLWREGDTEQAAVRRLVSGLFSTAVLTPRLLFLPTSPLLDPLFGEENPFRVDVPDIRVALPERAFDGAPIYASRPMVTVIWGSKIPDGAARRLYELLTTRNLVLEPFERALTGLSEVYPEWIKLK